MQAGRAQPSYGVQLRASMQTLRANEAQLGQFARGLRAVLQQWTALQLVAQHCDSRAPAVLYEDLCAWHQRDGEVYADDMELYFEDFFDNIRFVRIEDDSMQEVGTVLHDMYVRCCLDDFSLVERYLQTLLIYAQTNPVAMSVNGGTVEELDDDTEEGGEAAGDVDCEEDIANAVEEPSRTQKSALEAPQQPPQVPRQQQPQRKKRKNASVRSTNGWNIVK
ncbi:hypothetical protein LSCM1_03460 [Leishmania martiniquensis]|uniref:Pre-rRNA-processing protein TSR2 homolog n=1 Tax=Leishmania martiniquensis TaxID=1580590 RepID=A0A836G555_9TRYP|nr:hypothetical protein LSCM1_03460 [Leishmania martiniquensis]